MAVSCSLSLSQKSFKPLFIHHTNSLSNLPYFQAPSIHFMTSTNQPATPALVSHCHHLSYPKPITKSLMAISDVPSRQTSPSHVKHLPHQASPTSGISHVGLVSAHSNRRSSVYTILVSGSPTIQLYSRSGTALPVAAGHSLVAYLPHDLRHAPSVHRDLLSRIRYLCRQDYPALLRKTILGREQTPRLGPSSPSSSWPFSGCLFVSRSSAFSISPQGFALSNTLSLSSGPRLSSSTEKDYPRSGADSSVETQLSQ